MDARKSCLGLVLLYRVTFANPTLSSGDTPSDRTHRLNWGPYVVEVEEHVDREKRLTIRDVTHHVLYEISDAHIHVDFKEVTGRGNPELRVVHDPGGSCCSGTEHFFSRDGGFKKLFAVDRGHGAGLAAIRDLDGDSRPEILFNTEISLDSIPCSSSPGCRISRVVVVGWDGQRYRDRTRDFPTRSRRLAADYRRLLSGEHDRRENFIAGFYGNSISGGETRARRTILSLLSENDGSKATARSWFLANAAALRRQFTTEALEREGASPATR